MEAIAPKTHTRPQFKWGATLAQVAEHAGVSVVAVSVRIGYAFQSHSLVGFDGILSTHIH